MPIAKKRVVDTYQSEAASGLSGWHTLSVQRTVLVAVHTITSLLRLEDIAMLLEDNPTIQLIYTQVPDKLGEGVEQRLRELQVRVIPWVEASRRQVDLVIAASLHRIGDLPAKRKFAAPHGAGYNKRWPAWAWPGPDESRPVYGLDRTSLLDKHGQPILDALLLPHPDHLTTLTRQCPEAKPFGVVAGDPCYDRLLVCMERRTYYRAQLGIRDAQVLVAVASTWGGQSLFATRRELLHQLTTELPANHRVIVTLHPAVFAEHGTRQVRAWLREERAQGVDLVDADEDWRGLMAAADVLIVDHSSLAVYAAGVGIPVLLSHFAEDEIDSNSIMAALAAHSPKLDAETPLLAQLAAAREAKPAQWQATHHRVAARQGMSAEIVRETLYRLLALPEPPEPAHWPAVTVPRLVHHEPRAS